MNPRQPCDSFELENLLLDDGDLVQQSEVERHLENCEHCQVRLSQLAADEQFWTQTASHLSTVEQIELPARLTSRLNATSSFVVPTVSNESEPASASEQSLAMDTDWSRILDPLRIRKCWQD